MKVLIAGGGVAGLTLAALLRPRGHQITVVDPGHGGDDGFALALWPHGTRVLHAVGVHDRLVERGLPMRRYTARSGSGALLTTSGPPPRIARHGYLGILPRGDLVAMLATVCDQVEHRTGRVVALEQRRTGVDARLDDGTTIGADLLVGADGIGSAVRTALLGPQPRHDTGWTCATWWIESADHPGTAGETLEFWGAGSFVGCYPCQGRVCLIVGGPSDTVRGPQARAWLHRTLTGAGLPADRLLPGADHERRLWPMTDVRSTGWVRGRVALLGCDRRNGCLDGTGVGGGTGRRAQPVRRRPRAHRAAPLRAAAEAAGRASTAAVTAVRPGALHLVQHARGPPQRARRPDVRRKAARTPGSRPRAPRLS